MSTKEDMIYDNVVRLTDKVDDLTSKISDNSSIMAKYDEKLVGLKSIRESDRNDHKELRNRVLAHEKVMIDKIDNIIDKINNKVEEREKIQSDKISEIKKKMDDSQSKSEKRIIHLENKQQSLMESYNKRTIQDRIILACGAIGGGIVVLLGKNATEIVTRWIN